MAYYSLFGNCYRVRFAFSYVVQLLRELIPDYEERVADLAFTEALLELINIAQTARSA